jgi:hypothetical protein
VFKDLIAEVIKKGGDTDTNACIAGGLIGSILGFKNLPKDYLIIMLKLRLQKIHRKNPLQYEPSKGFVNLISLVKKFIVYRLRL